MTAASSLIVRNSPLLDEGLYLARQMRLFGGGRFGFVPMELLTEDDQVYPFLGAGPLRILDAVGPTLGETETEILLDYRPDAGIDPAQWPSYERHPLSARTFARRPSLDTSDRRVRAVVLELPAGLGADGAAVEPHPWPVHRVLLAMVEKSRGRRTGTRFPGCGIAV